MTNPHNIAPVEAPDLETALAAIRDSGMRVSAARRMVMEALFEVDEPVSAERIVEMLGGRSDPASVYRNLEALERVGLVRHMHLGHGPGLYMRIGLGAREYLICDVCGTHRAVEAERARPGARADPQRLRSRGQLHPLPDRRALRAAPGGLSGP